MRRFFVPVGLAVAAIYVLRVLFGPSGDAVENSGVHTEIMERPVTPPSVQPPSAQKETAALEAPAPDAQDKAEQGAPSKAEPPTATKATAALEAPAPDAQDTKAGHGAPSKAEPTTAKEASVKASKKVEQLEKPRARRAEARKKEASTITPKRKASNRSRKANRTARRQLPPHEAYLWDRAYPPPYIERRYLLPPLALRRHYWRDYEYY